MGRTDGLTDWRTDGQGGDYMLPRNFSGSIKIILETEIYHLTPLAWLKVEKLEHPEKSPGPPEAPAF